MRCGARRAGGAGSDAAGADTGGAARRRDTGLPVAGAAPDRVRGVAAARGRGRSTNDRRSSSDVAALPACLPAGAAARGGRPRVPVADPDPGRSAAAGVPASGRRRDGASITAVVRGVRVRSPQRSLRPPSGRAGRSGSAAARRRPVSGRSSGVRPRPPAACRSAGRSASFRADPRAPRPVVRPSTLSRSGRDGRVPAAVDRGRSARSLAGGASRSARGRCGPDLRRSRLGGRRSSPPGRRGALTFVPIVPGPGTAFRDKRLSVKPHAGEVRPGRRFASVCSVSAGVPAPGRSSAS